ncbi:hypothetical protein PMY38_07590 [Clostridium tertium]|jgi:hypothetical protein|uniref:hypothetical protein n=1 Tax=Clostridium TaxID=1485 RepID=UPI0015D4D575|nr:MULTISPECIES: hypothetical protein [Clostridium]MBU6137313.1 hypothetical protein [Clostridium tertium]MDB1956584.1 hypothetical protein [Clostridium tertium]MDB1958455.1 hypothetical protein [Clostridium tertium]MDB1962346.1 hypothetical protein [Clostridium tertium]MDB1967636.1 hypothetical protein [Clostridium tertium]
MSKLTPHELAIKTVMDIERRKYLREKGKLEADSFLAENRLKSFKNMSKIRCKTYRGK